MKRLVYYRTREKENTHSLEFADNIAQKKNTTVQEVY